MYLETVAIDTPARAATSRMVGFFFIGEAILPGMLTKALGGTENGENVFVERDDPTPTVPARAPHRRRGRPRQDVARAHGRVDADRAALRSRAHGAGARRRRSGAMRSRGSRRD